MVQVVTTVVVVWLIVVPVAGNNSGHLGSSVRGSSILSGVSDVAPSWLEALPQQTASFFSDSGFPVITDPFDDVPSRRGRRRRTPRCRTTPSSPRRGRRWCVCWARRSSAAGSCRDPVLPWRRTW
jgi:hypothetical protein